LLKFLLNYEQRCILVAKIFQSKRSTVRLHYLLPSLELLVAPVHLALYLDALLADHLDPHPPTVLLIQGSLAAVPSRVVSLQSKVCYKSVSGFDSDFKWISGSEQEYGGLVKAKIVLKNVLKSWMFSLTAGQRAWNEINKNFRT
jgi:hypothetical protein